MKDFFGEAYFMAVKQLHRENGALLRSLTIPQEIWHVDLGLA